MSHLSSDAELRENHLINLAMACARKQRHAAPLSQLTEAALHQLDCHDFGKVVASGRVMADLMGRLAVQNQPQQGDKNV